MNKSVRTVAWLAGLVWLAGLAAYPLLESTEARYASVAWHMAHGGSWSEPLFNGVLLFSKPPLAYWLGAIALKLLPDTAWAMRLPATAALLAAVWLTWRLARILNGDTAQTRIVPVLAALSPLAVAQGHMTTGDIFLWVGVVTALVMLCDRSLGTVPRAAGLGLGLALGFMAKGHMVLFWVIIPLAALSVAGLATAVPRVCRPWRWFVHPVTVLVFAALVVPWFALVIHRHPELTAYWLGHETRARFLSTTHGRAEPWWYFLVQVPLLMLPWLPELWRGLQKKREVWLPLCWVLVPLVLFSFSGSKRPNYLLPMVTPLALITAQGWPERPTRWLKWRTAGWLAVVLLWPFAVGWGQWGPPTSALVSRAAQTGHPLVCFGTAPSGLVFAHHGAVPVYGMRRESVVSGETLETADETTLLRQHFARGGWCLLHDRDVPELKQLLGRKLAVQAGRRGYVLVGARDDSGAE